MPQLSYCTEFIRTHDRNRYLCALSAPANVREAWFAVFGFSYEIASIADKIGEEMVGFVRYAWWRETLIAIYADNPPRGHPLAEVLAAIVRNYQLPKQHFDAIIDAHEKALAEQQAKEELYLDAITSPVMRLCCAALKRPQDEATAISAGIALAAVEAASLPTMDAENRVQFCALAESRLQGLIQSGAAFAGFAAVTRFYLQRLVKGRVISNADRAFWLPLYLWRKAA